MSWRGCATRSSTDETLGEVYGAPLYGIKTGLNEAFIIDTPTRDRLVEQDKKSAELLKPFLKGENIKRWRVEPEGLFLINTPKGKVDIEKYPAVRDWLLPFKPDLEKRATKQEWWELQQAQLAYQPKLERSKIVWPHFQIERIFALDSSSYFLNNKCFFLSGDDQCLLSLLNSTVSWFQLSSLARLKRGGYREAESQYVEQLAIPEMNSAVRTDLKKLADQGKGASQRFLEIRSSIYHRILTDLATVDRQKLTGKLENFWTLDFAAFRTEVKKAFKTEIPVKDREGWEKYLAEKSAEVRKLTVEIEAAEREIDAIVYRLFDLTPDEIKLLEDSLE